MSTRRSPLPLFVLGFVCIVFAALFLYSMPHGSPPLQPDGSISIATMEEYDRHFWKVYWIFGLGFAGVVFAALGCWRLFCRMKDNRDAKHGFLIRR